MFPQMVCLMFAGRLTDQMKSRILRTALEMAVAEQASKSFRDDDCEGQVTTDGEHASLGTFSGTVFEATVASGLGEATIRFIADTSFDPEIVDDIDSGWMSPDDLNRALTAHLN